jgi:HEPN domain-containing protein
MNVPLGEAKRWFRQAQEDLAVVRSLKSAGHYAAACFQAQQAGEKAMKAVLFSQGRRVVLGHSIRELVRLGERYHPAFADIIAVAGLLDQFYIPTRYPNGLPFPAIPSETYTLSQAEGALQSAEEVLAAVETFLHTKTEALREPQTP